MKSILDPTFQYSNSGNTDIRKTFARIRRQQKKQAEIAAARAAIKIDINMDAKPLVDSLTDAVKCVEGLDNVRLMTSRDLRRKTK